MEDTERKGVDKLLTATSRGATILASYEKAQKINISLSIYYIALSDWIFQIFHCQHVYNNFGFSVVVK